MKQKTHERISVAWRDLQELEKDHGFVDREEFEKVVSEFPDVTDEGLNDFYCKIRAEDPYGPENIKHVYIATAEDWNEVNFPAIPKAEQ